MVELSRVIEIKLGSEVVIFEVGSKVNNEGHYSCSTIL